MAEIVVDTDDVMVLKFKKLLVNAKQRNKHDPFKNAVLEPLDISDWDYNLKERIETNTKKLEKIFA